jgi:hypothetical protein
MLGHFFYFIGLLVFLIDLGLLTKFQKSSEIKEWVIKFNKVTKRNPVKSDFKGKDYENYVSFSFILILNFIWLFLGLLTKSWMIFSLILLFNILTNSLTKLIGEFSALSVILQFCKMVVITFSIGLLVINHYHLHLDLWRLIVPQW